MNRARAEAQAVKVTRPPIDGAAVLTYFRRVRLKLLACLCLSLLAHAAALSVFVERPERLREVEVRVEEVFVVDLEEVVKPVDDSVRAEEVPRVREARASPRSTRSGREVRRPKIEVATIGDAYELKTPSLGSTDATPSTESAAATPSLGSTSTSLSNGSETAPSTALPGAYVDAVRAALDAQKSYPRLALRQRRQGTVVVEVELDGQGRLERPPLLQVSSGHQALDDEALRMTSAAAPFPVLPDGRRTARVLLPVSFRLSRD
ncbi:MAG: energy transducer TonB [Myxococcales bacterium]|nr:energy transducer TonB [Myxococcales bacterium]